MSFIKKTILFFKMLFRKESRIKKIEESTEKIRSNNEDFKNSLKSEIIQENKKKKVETLTCFGDGLGIQTKISF